MSRQRVEQGSGGTSIPGGVLAVVLARAKSSYCKKNELDAREEREAPAGTGSSSTMGFCTRSLKKR
jgi:hypothetical protein